MNSKQITRNLSLKRILTIILLGLLITGTAIRLSSNKRSFNEQLRLVLESNHIIPVEADTVKYQAVADSFTETGTFEAFREVTISSEIQGKVVSIAIETGQEVSSGQPLAMIDNDLLRVQLEQARYSLEKCEKDEARFESLSKNDAATQQQFESAHQSTLAAKAVYANTNQQYEHSILKAPFGGQITRLYVQKGAFLTNGSPIADLMSDKPFLFKVKLTINQAVKTHAGQSTTIWADQYPNEPMHGTLRSINNKANASRQYEAELVVNPDQKLQLKPGMTGKVVFEEMKSHKQLIIPRSAIAGSILDPEIFVIKGDRVISKSITATILNEKEVIATGGLNPGDVIVTSGQLNLVNGTKIKVIKKEVAER